MTVPKNRGVVAPAERPGDPGEDSSPLVGIPLDCTPRGVVECDRALLLRTLIRTRKEMNPANPLRKATEVVVRMREDLARAATTPKLKKLAALAYALARNEVAVVDRASGRDALAYMGTEALRLHHTRSRKAAATKREESQRKYGKLLAMYHRCRKLREDREEGPRVSKNSIALSMRSKGAFDSESGERPSGPACYKRLCRLLDANGRRVNAGSAIEHRDSLHARHAGDRTGPGTRTFDTPSPRRSVSRATFIALRPAASSPSSTGSTSRK